MLRKNQFSQGVPLIIFAFITTLTAGLTGCAPDEKTEYSQYQPLRELARRKMPHPGVSTIGCEHIKGKKTVLVGHQEVDIRVPTKVPLKGDLLLLPGWDLPRTDWCMRSRMCIKAIQAGYRLIMPEMGKSVYSSQYFPETREDWRKYPGMAWVRDSLIPTLQNKYCLLAQPEKNFIVGVSAGARGVARIAQEMPGMFRAGVALSGDYDQTEMKGDNLMRGFFGDFEKFPERWKGIDNPSRRVHGFPLPLYLGHGKDDGLVPTEQTTSFYKKLKTANPDLQLVLHIAEGKGHDFNYWNSEVSQILDFFAKFDTSLPESP